MPHILNIEEQLTRSDMRSSLPSFNEVKIFSQTTIMRVTFLFLTIITVVIMADSGTTQRAPISDDALDMALRDRRYLMRQLKCALGEAACDPVGRRLKALAPLVLRGSCPRCTPREHRQIQRVLSHIQQNYPREWSKVVKQFAGGF